MLELVFENGVKKEPIPNPLLPTQNQNKTKVKMQI
jgi:hypothetical protein